jgi:hypothetical protein
MTMEKEKRINYQRKKTATMTLMLALILVLTGTFAWYSISQRALNKIDVPANSGGRIHDDFHKQDVIATISNTANKDVYAENFGENDLFVRIKLSEYLEVDGEVIAGSSNADGSIASYAPYAANSEARANVTWNFGGQKIFLPTFNINQNSLWTDAKGDARDVLAEQDPTWEGAQTGIGPGTHDYFVEGQVYTDDRYPNEERVARSTLAQIELPNSENLENKLIYTMAEWLALDEANQGGNFWVLDVDGWAYWANVLEAGEATSLLLNDITINSQSIEEDLNYEIDVVGEFATLSDLDKFRDNAYTDHGATSSNANLLLDTVIRREAQ